MTKIRYQILLLLFVGMCCMHCTAAKSTSATAPATLIKDIQGDLLLKVEAAKASNFQPGEGIENTYDGVGATIYHTTWGGTNFPVQLDYRLANAQQVDYLIYHPRTDSENGRFKALELWVSTKQCPDFTKVGDYDFKGVATPSVIRFDTPIQKPLAFRFIVKAGQAGHASCAEMEFYQKNSTNAAPEHIFSDATCSQLRPGITARQVKRIKNPFYKALAQELLSGAQPNKFRVQQYEAYPPVEETAKALKTGGYNSFENPTGIWFANGEEVVVFVENAQKAPVALRVHNFEAGGEDNTYTLFPGMNKLKMKGPGLGYLNYYHTNWASLPPVRVNIVGGKVNGYFDKACHNNTDWKNILDGAVCNILDIKGEYVNLAYSVEALRKCCPEKGTELIALYDEIIDIQHDILGLKKYNKRPKNHMFGRVIWNGFMHADGWGAAFHNNTLETLAHPERSRQNSWGIAHEFGHVNQVRPNMKWVGTTEVTNNIFSVWTHYLFNPSRPKLEIERIGDYDGHVIGGRFNAYMESAFINKEEWLTQAGPDRWKRWNGKNWGGDHFVKLCPLWQLQLYFAVAGKGNQWYQPDFYADIYNLAIEDTVSRGDAANQLLFIKRACDVTRTDLTDFFRHSGMLVPIDKYVDDYGCAQMTITQQQVNELAAYAARYKKPASPVMHYITANSVDAFRNQKAVEGSFAQGVERKGNQLVIDHQVWKNVTVFETYQDTCLIKVAIAGTGSATNSSTLVQFPVGATRVDAVAWDGKRTLVYGQNRQVCPR